MAATSGLSVLVSTVDKAHLSLRGLLAHGASRVLSVALIAGSSVRAIVGLQYGTQEGNGHAAILRPSP